MEIGGRKDGGNPHNSGEDQLESHRDDKKENSSGSRSYYECTFCKRGFTNAQALGGHMNIHRKDKSKIKPKPPKVKPHPSIPPLNCTSSAISQTLDDHQGQMNNYFSTHVPPPPPLYYYSHLPPSLPCNPNYPPGQLGFHGGDPDFNLNLQIGSSRTDHGYDDRDEEKDEEVDADGNDSDVVDLELRLGRPPTQW